MALSLRWSQHLNNKKEKEDFEFLVKNNTVLLSRLKNILEEEEQTIFTSETKLDDFSDPNWSHKQAFRNGQLSVLRKLKLLLP
jgi:hypothetical protein